MNELADIIPPVKEIKNRKKVWPYKYKVWLFAGIDVALIVAYPFCLDLARHPHAPVTPTNFAVLLLLGQALIGGIMDALSDTGKWGQAMMSTAIAVFVIILGLTKLMRVLT